MRHPQRRPDLDVTPASDGYLIQVQGSEVVTWLNRTGYLVMELCTGRNDESTIAEALRATFELTESPIGTVRATIADLITAGVVTAGENAQLDSPRVSITVWAPGPTVDRDVIVGLQALVAEAEAAGIPTMLTIDGDPSRRAARNRAANALLHDTVATHMLLLDAVPESVTAVRDRRIAGLAQSEHEVIGVPIPLGPVLWYRVREAAGLLSQLTSGELADYARSYDVSFAAEPDPGLEGDRFLEALHCSSAAMLVRRSALERIAGSGVARRNRGQIAHGAVTLAPSWGFFDPGASADGIDIDEDFAFCERVRDAGGSVMVDVSGGFRTFLEVTARLRADHA